MTLALARGREPANDYKRARARPAPRQQRPVIHQTRDTSFCLPGDVPYRRQGTVEMSVDEWNGISKNPRQRDEVVRVEKGRVGHLLETVEKHREVAMAVLPDGRRYKVDGHTRTAVWSMGLAPAPDSLLVDVYACADEAAVRQLYDVFDNSAASESGTDRVTGAYREAGIAPTSAMLKEGGISTAIRQLYHYIHKTAPSRDTKNVVINKGVKMFAPEIMALDAIEPTRFTFPCGIIMGAILTFGDSPELATKFWSAYVADAGWKDDCRVDAVQALVERRNQLRGKSSGARDNLLMSYGVAAFQGFQKRATYKSRYLVSEKSKDLLRKYAEGVMAKKEGN